jgi:hypothetical protein
VRGGGEVLATPVLKGFRCGLDADLPRDKFRAAVFGAQLISRCLSAIRASASVTSVEGAFALSGRSRAARIRSAAIPESPAVSRYLGRAWTSRSTRAALGALTLAGSLAALRRVAGEAGSARFRSRRIDFACTMAPADMAFAVIARRLPDSPTAPLGSSHPCTLSRQQAHRGPSASLPRGSAEAQARSPEREKRTGVRAFRIRSSGSCPRKADRQSRSAAFLAADGING